MTDNIPMSKPFTRDDFKPCVACRKPLMASNPLGIFWRISAERLILDLAAVRREAGLEMMMGGSVARARAFSPKHSFALPLVPAREMLICDTCLIERGGDLAPAFLPEDDE